MKTRLLILGILISFQASATWLPLGPEGVVANNVCFVIDNMNHWVICHDEGICIYDHVTQTWTDHPSDLPIRDAYYLDGDKILVIMGNGSYSDGIYAFNPASNQYELIKYLESPQFIHFNDTNQKYYVGYHLGFVTSPDGFIWTTIEIFNNKSIVTMDTYQNHFVVSEMDNQYGIWYSDDYGSTWVKSLTGSPMISCLVFDNDGKLYGIYPDESWSSGLWSSTDYGQIWEVEFWSINMSCVGFDAMASIFVGWGYNPTGTEEGIALYIPEDDSLRFLNEGLPNLIVNKITHNPWMTAIALFCCTENGVYVTYDYVGVIENKYPGEICRLNILPNPVIKTASVNYLLPEHTNHATLLICQQDGKTIWENLVDHPEGSLKLDCSDLPSGIYYVILRGRNFSTCKKMLVR
ncbi:MAG: hypothetical protein IMY70_05435 [Bacteroidetes bacterium]|nr:hypothetical protein [Bacteroidota bacterium]